MNSAANTETAKTIARSLRSSFRKFDARAHKGQVFVRTSEPTWYVGDFLPPGWGAREVAGKYDVLVIKWVG